MLGIKIDFDKRIYGFDLLRAFAIFCVVHGHGRHLLTGTFFEKFPWFPLPHGVDILFVLSGFLIGYSFINSSNNDDKKLSIQKTVNFWKRSAFRILPNYYLILAVNYFLVHSNILSGNTEQFSIFYFITFTQNLFSPFYDFFWESWSLAVQEWFYLLFPLLLLIITRWLNTKTGVLLISSIFIGFALYFRFSLSSNEYDSFWWDVNFRKVTASRIDCIFFGVLAAWFRYYYPLIWKKYALHFFIIGIGLFVVLVNVPRHLNTIYLNVFYLSISSIYIMLWFPLIDKLKDVKSVVGRIITVVSILSYAMYLLNLLLIQLINKHFPELLSNQATLKYFLYWIITLCLSYMLYYLFENPISSYGNKVFHTTKMMYKRMLR